MKKKIFMKKALVIALSGAIFATSTANAAVSKFNKSYVDSNQWTKVASASKETNSELVRVKISAIYKANGNASNYKRVKGYIGLSSNGYMVTNTKRCWKVDSVDDDGKQYDGYTLFSVKYDQYRYRGTKLAFVAMGNDPSLDCRISGKVNFDYN